MLSIRVRPPLTPAMIAPGRSRLFLVDKAMGGLHENT
jgi:hypothetical protein